MSTALGICSTVGTILALLGAWRLYRFTPYFGSNAEGNAEVSMPNLPLLPDLKREHRRCWALILGGFALQFVGSLGWLAALFQ